MIRIEKEQGGIGLISLDARDFEKIGEDLLTESILPEDLSDVIEKLESPADDAEALLDDNVASSVEQESEDSELDLSAGELDKGSDPVRLYLREMGTVPLLKREQEVSIAKRIEAGLKRAQRALSRSPIAMAELLRIGEELAAGRIGVRDVVNYSDDSEIDGQEDRGDESLPKTIASLQGIRKLYQRGLRESGQFRLEHKLSRGKKSKKLSRLKRKLARTRLDVAQEIAALSLKEPARKRLTEAIGATCARPSFLPSRCRVLSSAHAS